MDVEPGCYGVVQMPGVKGWAIRTATRSWANHAFLVVGENLVIESWKLTGIRFAPLDQYEGHRVEYNHEDRMSKKQRQAIVRYAEAMIGTPYDYWSFVRLGLVGLGFQANWVETINPLKHAMICSKFVALAGAQVGLDWTNGEAMHLVTPGTLAARLSTGK